MDMAAILRTIILLAVLASTQLIQAQSDSTICYLRDPDGRIREHNVDFIKMLLDVKLDAKQGKVTGLVKYDFKPIQYVVDTIFLNAPGIGIKQVLLDGKEVKFDTAAEGVTIRFAKSLDWNKQYKLDISYEAQPRKGMYFIGWNVTAENTTKNPYFTRKQIWTQGQGIDNRHWIPCYDDVNDKLITETVITFDSNYTVISNGVLKSKKANADKTYTWHYAMDKPMVPYLIMVGIDKFGYRDYKSKNGITSRQYYYADRPETAEPTYRYSAEMMDWMVAEYGVAYPWQTYCNVPVQDFMYGAMENTTATIYGDFYLNDKRSVIERAYTATNAHELTHQWFGDYITEYSGSHHWLHESFATYYAKQFMRHVHGEDQYEAAKRGEANSAIGADNRDRYPVGSVKGGSSRHYPKGSFVIDMLRYTLGDSVYKKCITNYLKKYAYANVDNHAFMMAFMETAGANLDWFFDQWVYRSGVPNYVVNYEKLDGKVAFYIQQTHKVDELTDYFKMPVVVELHFKDGTSTSVKQWTSHQFDTIYIPINATQQIAYVLFDPASNLLKTVTFNKTFEELQAQALGAKHMIDRYDAVYAMRTIDLESKRAFLVSLFDKHNYSSIQDEIIMQLAKDSNQATLGMLKKALHDKDFMVRRSVVDNIGDIPAYLLSDVEALLTDTSYNTIETTLRKLVRQHPENATVYLDKVKGILGINNNVRITYLELAAKQYNWTADNKQLDELTEFTSNKYEFRTRVKALEAAERVGYANEKLMQNLMNASLYTNNRINGPASRTLKNLIAKDKEYKKLAEDVYLVGVWKDWEKVILERLLGKTK